MIIDVYVDLLFLINFSMDLMCFYITSAALKLKLPSVRAIIASLVGGAYSVFALIGGLGGITLVICDTLVCIFMVLIIFFDKDRGALKYAYLCVLYLGISMLLGGIMSGIFTLLSKLGIKANSADSDSMSVFLFAFIALLSAFFSIRGIRILSKKSRHRLCRIRIKINGREYILLGLIDSGNLVTTPLGKGVIFIDRSVLADSIPIDADKKFLQGEYYSHSASVISIHTVSGNSLCVTFKPDCIYISLKKENGEYEKEYQSDCLISIFDVQSNQYSAIVPESAISNL